MNEFTQEEQELYEKLKDEYFTNYMFDIPSVYNGFTYKVNPDGLEVVNFDNSALVNGCLSIPTVFSSIDTSEFKKDAIKEIDLGKVTNIYVDSFVGFVNLYKISGEYVRTINKSAFRNCYSLREFNFPSVVAIGEEAFSGCSNLLKVSLPSLSIIGDRAFYECVNLEEVDIHRAKMIIQRNNGLCSPKEVFKGCVKLSKVDISAANMLGEEMFSGCIALKELSIRLVRVIKAHALAYCESLDRIYIDNLLLLEKESLLGCTSLKEINYYGDSEAWSHVQVEDINEVDVCKGANIVLNYRDPE